MASSPFRSRPVPTLIQGVSQQSASQRRDNQCAAQFNCMNSVKWGSVARSGADVMAFFAGVNASGAFVNELLRGVTEHYLQVLKGGSLSVYDLILGTATTVTDTTGPDGYLASAALPAGATVTISNAAPGVVTWANHGLSAGSPVQLTTTGTLPAPLAINTVYYVLPQGLTTGAFQLGTFLSSDPITTTTNGSGTHTAHIPVLDVDNFRVQVVSDTTFIANKSISPAMAVSPVSPSRPPEALVFFQAGAYLTTYTISIQVGGNIFRWLYTTPDNSSPGNAKYITTNQLAATFYRAMTGVNANDASISNIYGAGAPGRGDSGGSGSGTLSVLYTPTLTSTVTLTIASPCVVSWPAHGLLAGSAIALTTTGALPTGLTAGTTYYILSAGLTANSFEVSATVGGAAIVTSGSQSGTQTATLVGGLITSLGFSIAINGNLLRIWRPNDSAPLTIDVADGTGGNGVTAFMSTVQSFTQLPKGGFQGFQLQVVGATGAQNAGATYWVNYVNQVASDGYWQECCAPGITTTLNAATMPHTILNSAVDTFQINQATWLPRICGDAVNVSLNPGFVGKYISELSFYQQRLMILTNATVDLSVAGQQFTFFQASAQVGLATDPISLTIAAGKTTALLTRAVSIDESLVLWAQLAQFRLNGGISPLSPSTVQDPPTTCWEYNENGNFVVSGTSVFFSYEADAYATVFNAQFQAGRAVGDPTEVTAHCSEYIPAGVRRLSVSQPLSLIFVGTDGDPNSLYLYNFMSEGQQLVQSAWNCWRFPQGQIVWHGVFQQYLYVAMQRADGLLLLKCPLNPANVDPGGTYRTRLDFRLTEATVNSVIYSAAANTTTIVVPYTIRATEADTYRCIIRTTSGNFVRGQVIPITSISGTSIVVPGDLTAASFYVGFQVSSLRQESIFFVRTATGVIPYDDLTVRNYVLHYELTGYTRLDATTGGSRSVKQELFPVGAQSGTADAWAGTEPALVTGKMEIPVNTRAEELTITLTNDSHLPSRWQTCEWSFTGVQRAAPMLTPYGGPVQ